MEAFPQGVQRGRENTCLADYRHEVSIAFPAWDNVAVEMSRNASAGGAADIKACLLYTSDAADD